MLNEFVDGFLLAGGFGAWLLGIIAAVLLVLLVLALAAIAVGKMFDGYTRWLAHRIRKKRRKPRNLLERIILEHESNAV